MEASLTFTALAESDDHFESRFNRLWPALQDWYLRDGDANRPSYAEARQALHTHMPELIPQWERYTELAGGGDLAARVLSLYDPPPLFAGCSVLAHDGKLTRNYDFHPDRIEGTILRTPRALGVADCLWGLLDGINESGLGIALAFGGRRAHGRGFAVSLVVRYVLETCATVAEAVDTLKRVPVHAPYNLTVAGPSEAVTVFVGPDRAARVVRPAVATNHQEHVDWPEHAAFTRSVERREALLAGADLLGPELYAEDYDEGFGTLYTAEYELRARAVTYRWPGEEWPLSLDAFTPAARTVRLRGRAVGAGPR